MLILTETTDTLEIVLAGAVTTNQLPVVVSWRDVTTTTFEAGRTTTTTNGATPVIILSSPAASTQRCVDYIIIRNEDTVSATVTVTFDDNGTPYTIGTFTLDVGEQLQYTDANGWQSGEMTGGGGGGGAPTSAQYLVGATDGTLTAERVVTNTATVTWDLATGGQAKADVVDGTTTVKGAVELATDGEVAANVVVQGNDARLSNSRTPTSHAASHEDGGGDEISVLNLSGLLADGQTPLSHSASHENGGSDEISVAGLSGLLADNQNPVPTAGADTTAIHDNVASEISAITVKATPAGGDFLVIEDSAAGNVKKHILISSLPSGSGDVTGPASSTDDRMAAFDGVTGKLIKEGTVTATSVASHLTDTANPHATDVGNLGSGTLAELNTAVTDATLDDSGDSRPPNGAAGGDLGGTYPNPTVDDGADGTAIHDNVASEISAITNKATPVGGDFLVIEDSAAGNVKKHILVSSLPSGSGDVTGPASSTDDRMAAFDGVTGKLIKEGTVTATAVASHLTDTANPHATDVGNLGSGTLAELNTAVTDATLDTNTASRPPNGAAGGDLGGTYPNPTVDDGADGSALHDNVASEISAITNKATPVGGDFLVIEDSAAANVKKHILISSLPGGGDVTGPASSVDDRIAAFDSTTGKLIKEGTVTATSVASHLTDTANPHATDVGNLGSGTLAELNTAVTDATLDTNTASRPPNGAAGGDLNGTYPNPLVDDGADGTAIHDNVASEISAITNKATPVGGDFLVIEDSAAANVKKHILISSLPGGGDVTGPASSVDDRIAAFDSTTGKLIKEGTVTATSVASHLTDTANPHATDLGNLGSGTLAELNTAVTDATLDDSGDSRPPNGAAGGDLNGTYPNPLVDDGADGTAIHDNVASEISAITVKATPVSGDFLVIEDSAAGNVKKHITVGSLPGGTSTLAATLVAGNTTGGEDIDLSSGDVFNIIGSGNRIVGDGSGFNITGGTGSGALTILGTFTGGGDVSIIGGEGTVATVGGDVTIQGGIGGPTNADAGNVILRSGVPGGSGDLGVINIQNTSLQIIESSAVQGPTIAATEGRFWVRDDTPNTPMFTDDAGTDHDLTAPAATIAEVDGDITTTSATDVVATSMTITPASGTYSVWFAGTVGLSGNNSEAFCSIHSAGTQVAASERRLKRGAGQGDVYIGFSCMALVTVNGSQAIEGQWRVGAGTGTMYAGRQLMIVEVS